MILKNKAQCGICKDIIESTHVHDFVRCTCGSIFVDGGHDYLRRGGKFENIIELSEVEDLLEVKEEKNAETDEGK